MNWTQEEIIEYNKRCSEFLGFKYRNHAKFWGIYPLDNNSYLRQLGYVRMDNLKFHSDWNWIMEVLIKIKPLVCEAEFTHRVGLSLRELQKEKVIEGINQFLIWYNENKNEIN